MVEISQNFVAFLEYMNFKLTQQVNTKYDFKPLGLFYRFLLIFSTKLQQMLH